MQKTYNNSYETVFDKCKKALAKLDYEITYQSKKDGNIGANTGTSLWSWGESIDIQVKNIAQNKTKVAVKSTSKAQLIDWGKNERNEKKVLDSLSDLIG